MVADGSYNIFKAVYKQAVKNNLDSFMFDNQKIDINYAKYVCEYVDKHCMPEYDKHLQDTLDDNKHN